MSLNIVDTVIDYCNENDVNIGLIPSRRQVDHTGGYVNNWTTPEFSKYVKSKSDKVLLVRDHSGPNQGEKPDNGMQSFSTDCRYFDVIHIDPWKAHSDYHDGLNTTLKFIDLGFTLNKNLKFEVGTEEAIRRFTEENLEQFAADLFRNLDNTTFASIQYLVIQSGTALKQNTNTGEFSEDRLKKMIEVCKRYNLISKEHNGDYLPNPLLKRKFELGLQSINIAPEFGQIETSVILSEIKKVDPSLIEDYFVICRDSKRWEKWVDKKFDPNKNKLKTINICGHYVFSNPEFLKLKHKLGPDVDIKIRNKIKKRINEIIKL